MMMNDCFYILPIVTYINFKGNHNGYNAAAWVGYIVTYINFKGNHNGNWNTSNVTEL